jgi:hypothetical protein
MVDDQEEPDATLPARWVEVGSALASNQWQVKHDNTKDDVIECKRRLALCLHPTTGRDQSNSFY